MKKYVMVASAVLTLAGCTASIAIADMQKALPVTGKAVKDKVIKYLKTRVGKTSYVFSGSSPRGWDCSGMVRWTYAQFGLELPHSANKQGHIGTRVSKPKIGDIVVFAYQGSKSFYHSAIYIGNGKIVHANQARKTTVIERLTDYRRSQIRFVRVIPTV